MKKIMYVLVLFLGSVVFATASGNKEESSQAINVYTNRTYDVDQDIYAQFTEETGIRVNVVSGKADELIERVTAEGEKTDMDLLFLSDVGRIVRAKERGLLVPIKKKTLLSRVPKGYKDGDNKWIAVTKRARVIAYDKQKGRPEGVNSYEDLAKPNTVKVLVRSSSHPYNISLITHILALRGEAYAKTWVSGIVHNLARSPSGNDRDQMRTLIGGLGDVAIVNSYYVGLLVSSDDKKDRAVGERIGLIFPPKTNINVSVIAKGKHNNDKADMFIAYLLTKEVQEQISNGNFEYPVVEGAKVNPLLASWGNPTLPEEITDLNIYGKYLAESTKISDEYGWK